MKTNYAYGSLVPYLDLSNVTCPLDTTAVFGRSGALEVEIGFGTGEYITRLATEDPAGNYLGFEQSAKRTLTTLRKIHADKLSNIRLMMLDAVWGFQYLLPIGSLRKVHCLYPCPWPKKRHAKHRLLQTDVLKLFNSRLVLGGMFYLVTDHRPYADWVLEQLPGTGFRHQEQTIGTQYGTKFEKKWAAEGQEKFFALELVKAEDADWIERSGGEMRVYFIDHFDPDKIEFSAQHGEFTIEFNEYTYDPKRSRAMVHAIVTEDRRTQHLWVSIVKTPKGWCVSAAHGSTALPTQGMRRAVDLVFQAVEKTTK